MVKSDFLLAYVRNLCYIRCSFKNHIKRFWGGDTQ